MKWSETNVRWLRSDGTKRNVRERCAERKKVARARKLTPHSMRWVSASRRSRPVSGKKHRAIRTARRKSRRTRRLKSRSCAKKFAHTNGNDQEIGDLHAA